MKTVKVKLDKLTSRFFIYTHCDKKQYVANESLDENAVITCAVCERPFIMKDSYDDWYYTGDKVF